MRFADLLSCKGRWQVKVAVFLAVVITTLYLKQRAEARIYDGTQPAKTNGAPSRDDHFKKKKNEPVEEKFWTMPAFPVKLLGREQYDEELIAYIRHKWVISPPGGASVLKEPKVNANNHSKMVDELLDRRTNGFFVECGAGDGEDGSTTLFFEQTRHWTGLLIEARPFFFTQLLKKRRHVWAVNACVSPSGRTRMLNYTVAGLAGGLTAFMDAGHLKGITKAKEVRGFIMIPCFPLYSILKAINVTNVDYFSLDVVGPELEILNTVPLDAIKVEVFSVAHGVTECPQCSAQKKSAIQEFFYKTGNYEQSGMVKDSDLLFKKVNVDS